MATWYFMCDSDIHYQFTGNGELTSYKVETIPKIQKLQTKPDLLIVSGDVTDNALDGMPFFS